MTGLIEQYGERCIFSKVGLIKDEHASLSQRWKSGCTLAVKPTRCSGFKDKIKCPFWNNSEVVI